jgi:ABC-type multidrug transport system fused ATPase/permease subunit
VSDVHAKKSDEEIIELAKKMHIEDVIEDQENGLDGLLGNLSNKGRDLSGGQWQKVALLRAVYRDKTDIIILDEPTAALDPLAEAELYRNFAQIVGERTTLFISHRLGIAKLVDRILVFKNGCIVEDGSHQDLISRKGYYYEMYQAQADWYKIDKE